MATNSTGRESLSRATALRRIGAFCVDYVICACYGAALFGVVLLWNGGRVPQRAVHPLQGQAIGLFCLTIPVILYFAICESSRWQSTIGKRLLGLRVHDMSGDRLPFRKTLMRALLKFLPWELGHTVVHQLVSGAPSGGTNDVPPWVLVLFTVAVLLDAWYLTSIWVGTGRTAYDRASSAQVVIAPR